MVNGVEHTSAKLMLKELKEHLSSTFNPFNINNPTIVDIVNFLDVPCQMDRSIKPISSFEVQKLINKLNNTKTPGYDNFDAKVLKYLPRKAIAFLTAIYNTILINNFPSQLK